jgi:hypothetical protein
MKIVQDHKIIFKEPYCKPNDYNDINRKNVNVSEYGCKCHSYQLEKKFSAISDKTEVIYTRFIKEAGDRRINNGDF